MPVRHDTERTWIRARPEWVHPILVEQLATAGEVEQRTGQAMGDPGRYLWAWINEDAGVLRSRYFATDVGILEDEATGAAAVVMGGLLGRPMTIRQGVGSEIVVRPQPDGTVEIGGRVEPVETREYVLPQ